MSSGSSASAAAQIPPLGHAVGGALGSALALLLFYPLERARIEMQSGAATSSIGRKDIAKISVAVEIDNSNDSGQQPIPSASDSSDASSESWVSCVDPEQETTRNKQIDIVEQPLVTAQPSSNQDGLLPTLTRLYEKKELYRGAGSIVVTLATSSFVFFYAHQLIMQGLVSERDAKKSAVLSLLGSSLAGMVNVLLTNPMWVANMRIVKGSQSTLWRELRNIVQSDGWKSLWNGTGASLLLVSNPVLQFYVYDRIKASRLKSRATLSPIEAFCVGALAKAIATVVTYPLQLAQVLLRLQQGGGTWECLVNQFDRGGVKALYTGMKAKLLQTVLTAAFTFLTYEQILRVVRAALLLTAQKRDRQRDGLGSNI